MCECVVFIRSRIEGEIVVTTEAEISPPLSRHKYRLNAIIDSFHVRSRAPDYGLLIKSHVSKTEGAHYKCKSAILFSQLNWCACIQKTPCNFNERGASFSAGLATVI